MGRAARNPDTGLTDKEEKFCNAIVYDGMGDSEAYRAAYKCGRMSAESIRSNASKLKNSTHITLTLESMRNELREAVKRDAIMTREEALERLSLISRATMLDIASFDDCQIGDDENGDPVYQTTWKIKNSKDMTLAGAAVIKSVTATKMGPKLEVYDATTAIKLMADLEGWNAPKKTELSGGITVEQPVKMDGMDKADRDALKALLERNAHIED